MNHDSDTFHQEPGSARPLRLRVLAARIGIGMAGMRAPQGPLHIHNGTGGLLFATKTAIGTTAQVIIPNGTGERIGNAVQIRKTAGTTSRSARCDYLLHYSEVSR